MAAQIPGELNEQMPVPLFTFGDRCIKRLKIRASDMVGDQCKTLGPTTLDNGADQKPIQQKKDGILSNKLVQACDIGVFTIRRW